MGERENKEMPYGLSDISVVLMLQKAPLFSYATK